MSDSEEIPESCYWDFSVASGGGMLIQSLYNSYYLYYSGTSIALSSTTGTAGTTAYYRRVWRIATKSYISERELTSFSASTLKINSGDTKAVTMSCSPSNSLWVTAADFSYSGYSTSYTSLSSSTGKFTCKNYDYSVNTVTATHKTTGCTATFKLVTNPVSAILIGIEPTDERDREEVLEDVATIISSMNYSYSVEMFGSFAATKVMNLLANDSYNVFLSRSHGDTSGTSYTYIITNESSTGDTYYVTSTKLKSYDLSNMKLILFVGCYTGYGGNGGNNLPTVAVSQGAETAIGFKNTITCDAANSWTVNFFTYMAEGFSVEEACFALAKNTGGGTGSYVICGNADTTLT
ncbi:MAG: hypothetical protein LUG88_06680 [Clostridia bacterium]|nr:hypothetical protein [Clostridia bacterium]